MRTIRRSIQIRVRVLALISLAGGILIGLGVAFLDDPGMPAISMFTLGGLLCGIAVVSAAVVRCPSCSTFLGKTANEVAFPKLGRLTHGRTDFCPFCGVSFDEPAPKHPDAPLASPTANSGKRDPQHH
jgi:hypothetical protein